MIRGTASARQEYAAGKLAAEVAVESLIHEQDQFLASVPGLIDLRVADQAR